MKMDASLLAVKFNNDKPLEICRTISFFVSLFPKSSLTEFPIPIRKFLFFFIHLYVFIRVYVQYKVASNPAP